MNAIEHSQADSKLSQLSCDILEKIGQGDLLKEEESHILRRIFVEAKTLHPKALTSNHLKDLSFSTSSYDLRNHAIYIANVDRSLRHFGIDAEDMYTTDIIAHQRGGWLDSTDQKRSLTYIQQWLDFSKGFKSKEAELGYLLHLPLFMRNNTSTETK
ncbi:hypothetical protein EB796_016463 [Bugula neritina]|uniref:Uncharacterized protein n=1 Tax=Bugula neritina TaxID=10212 RepID=A0A7J7JGS6_BUGNE|nr:hypothetical protein EB796_016463 [Bugula neritina]